MKFERENKTIFLPAKLFLLLIAIIISAGFQSDQQVRVPQSVSEMKLSFAPIVRQAAPAVVNVYVRQRVRSFRSPFMDDPFFRFFDDRFGVPQDRMQSSLGSGVIINPKGLVVTNYHVIKGGERGEIKVALSDKREFYARIILKDERTDLAVLAIKDGRGNFPYLQFADSDGLSVGDLVLAIGNPFGVGQTVTSGIVSALARTAVSASDYQAFIQTDAAINPGNSGGALVNMEGKLIGINTAIFSRSGGSNGIGFAIPSNLVRLVARSAEKGGRVRRPWFGAGLQIVTSDIAQSLNLERPTGALITQVHSASPAEIAGLRPGDVIVRLGANAIDSPKTFRYRFATLPIGNQAVLQIRRNGRLLSKRVSLIAAPFTPRPNRQYLEGNHPFSGAEVANLSPALAEQNDLNDVEGIVILNVAARSFAANIGLRAKDILVSLNKSSINSVRDLKRTVRVRHRIWRIEIKRGDKILRLVLPG